MAKILAYAFYEKAFDWLIEHCLHFVKDIAIGLDLTALCCGKCEESKKVKMFKEINLSTKLRKVG